MGNRQLSGNSIFFLNNNILREVFLKNETHFFPYKSVIVGNITFQMHSNHPGNYVSAY